LLGGLVFFAVYAKWSFGIGPYTFFLVFLYRKWGKKGENKRSSVSLKRTE